MGGAQFVGLFGVEGRMNASEHHIGAPSACHSSDFVAAESIGGVDANANNVALLNLSRAYRCQSLIHQARIAKAHGCSRRENIQPARGNDCSAERNFAGINEMNAHAVFVLLRKLAE